MRGVVMSETNGVTELGRDALREVLERAARTRCRAHLRSPDADGGPVASGAVAGLDGTCLRIDVERVFPAHGTFSVGMTLQVSLEVGDDRYVFRTRCVTGLSAAAPGVLRLEEPATAQREERRRSPRRRLKEPTDIVLHENRVQARWRCRASLLNLSADGLACKVPCDEAEELGVGQTVCVMLRPAGETTAFDLEARVSNLTEAGTPDHWIVGLEFVHDTTPPGSRARLEEILNR